MRTALVTGASGFIGRALAGHLTGAGWRVVSARRHQGPTAEESIVLGPAPWSADLLSGAIETLMPDAIFHMAGLTKAPTAAAVYEANTVLAAQLIEAVLRQKRPPAVILAGSAAEYGPVPPDANPVAESRPCHPATDYAISKYAQTLMALARARAHGDLRVLVARIWNPVGPDMPSHLALASFAAQIAAMPPEGGKLYVGNLDVARDFIDVGEAARLIAVLADRPDAYGAVCNVCSGRAYTLRSLVDRMIALSGRSIEVVVDPGRTRVGEATQLYGDTGRLGQFGLSPTPPDFGLILPELLANQK
jgi:nucleoside-diphosphate-sugar epimerase